MIEPSIVIRDDVELYKASVWKIQAMTYLVLFFYIIGSHHYTRYQHGICYGEYWIRYSFKMHGTVRELYGMDAAERWNNEIKEMVLTLTNKFASIRTLEDVLKLAWIKRYYLREESDHSNTAAVAAQNRVAESIRDDKLIHFTDSIREYFDKMNILGETIQDKLLRYIQEPNLYSKLDIFPQSLDPGSSLDSDENYSSDSEEDDVSEPDILFVDENTDTPKMIAVLKHIDEIKLLDTDSKRFEQVHIRVDKSSFRLQQRNFVLSTQFVVGMDDNDEPVHSQIYEIHYKTNYIYRLCYFERMNGNERDSYLFFKFSQPPTLLTSQWDSERQQNRFQINTRNCAESMVCIF